jgi:hypothetical protein
MAIARPVTLSVVVPLTTSVMTCTSSEGHNLPPGSKGPWSPTSWWWLRHGHNRIPIRRITDPNSHCSHYRHRFESLRVRC